MLKGWGTGRGVAAAVVLLALALACPARAGDAALGLAEFNAGQRDMNATPPNWATAAEHLRKSVAADPSPGGAADLAFCEEQLGRSASALLHIDQAISLLAHDDKRHATFVALRGKIDRHVLRLAITLSPSAPRYTKVLLDGIEVVPGREAFPLDPGAHAVAVSAPGRVPRRYDVVIPLKAQPLVVEPEAERSAAETLLTIVWPADVPADARVTLDGALLTPATARLPRTVTPGEHVATVTLPGHTVWRKAVTVNPGAEKELRLALGAMTQIRPAPPPPSPPPQDQDHTARWIALGVGGVGVATSLVAGGLGLAAKGRANDHCPNRACDSEGLDAIDSGKRWTTIGSVAAGIGLAGVGTGVILWMTSNPSPTGAELALQPAGLALTGRF